MPHRSDGYRLVGDTVKHQEWVSPALNTTADGSLYFTVRDLARWAAGLDRARVLSARRPGPGLDAGPAQRRRIVSLRLRLDARPRARQTARVGHTGAWQGFRTSLERFPAAHLTVIVLANLAEAEPRAIALGHRRAARPVAGAAASPGVPAPRRLSRPSPWTARCGPWPTTRTSSLLTPGLRRFLSPAERGANGASWAPASRPWTALGCDRRHRAGRAARARKWPRWCYAREAAGRREVSS